MMLNFEGKGTAVALALAALGIAGVGAATGPDCLDCPDYGVKEITSSLRFGPSQQCGTGLKVDTGGLKLHNAKRECPTFAIYEPVHHLSTPKVGFRTTPGAKLPVQKISFKCIDRWLLGFIPIPISSHCTVADTQNVSSIQNYVEHVCEGTRGRTGGGR